MSCVFYFNVFMHSNVLPLNKFLYAIFLAWMLAEIKTHVMQIEKKAPFTRLKIVKR